MNYINQIKFGSDFVQFLSVLKCGCIWNCLFTMKPQTVIWNVGHANVKLSITTFRVRKI